MKERNVAYICLVLKFHFLQNDIKNRANCLFLTNLSSQWEDGFFRPLYFKASFAIKVTIHFLHFYIQLLRLNCRVLFSQYFHFKRIFLLLSCGLQKSYFCLLCFYFFKVQAIGWIGVLVLI